jgi:peptidyl-tRNA hydrolase, PTH2 family
MSLEDNNKILNIISKYDDYKHSFYNIDEKEQSYVMYNVVNTSLKMGKGKLAAQVGHGVHKIAQYCLQYEKEIWMKYINSNIPKIVLKTKSQDHLMEVIEKTKDIFKCYVVDEGRTQIAKNSLTVVSYIPMLKENAPDVLKELKLL